MKLRFSIRDLLWLTLVASLLLAWWADHRRSVRVSALTPTAHPPNLHLWVPDEELNVWDPVNVNVMPVPWRVRGPKGTDGKHTSIFRHTAVGKRIQVEGIAWGYDVETELPKSQVILDGGVLLVEGVEFFKPELRGKLVQVVGTLRLNWMPTQGFELQKPHYYCLEAESLEIIDRINEPEVVLIPSKAMGH